MLSFLRSKFPRPDSAGSTITQINERRRKLAGLQDGELKCAAERARDINEIIAVTAVVAARVLRLEMFDVQLRGALALANGKIVEMQTGEGKTLTAVPPIIWYAKDRGSIHVMTVNDYLALRDARWMGGIYEFFGLTVGCIRQGMGSEERKHAYASDITYATANEIGFDYLRDQIALYANHQVHRPFAAALVDEADSILIDEARIPLVVAGSESDQDAIVFPVDHLVRRFRPLVHYTLDEHGRNVALTDAGVEAVEGTFDRGNLFAEENLALHTAVQNSLHAHALLRRDVDYLVKNGAIESVDEFKGRIVQERRWPAALHTAIEVKEGVAPKVQGRVLGSITMENLLSLYPKICGMTGTAATQAKEFQSVYGLEVEAIPTNRPVIRVDHPDVIFRTLREKEQAVLEEIRREHEKGRPVLVGTVSVEESERLSARLGNIPHQTLNARNEEEEAAIIARAGERGAVTISTNMAGRGTDIKLGAGVAELGGLHVIGTNRHESRRIDNQLRGRAGRQGDPGSSRFFVSYQDDLMVKYGIDDPKLKHNPESIQRMVEGESLDIRNFLHKYEGVVEGQRQAIEQRRQGVLTGATLSSTELERLVSLTVIDDLWAEHLAAITELREGIHWVELGGRVPIHEYLKEIHKRFEDLEARVPEEVRKRLAEAKTGRRDPSRRGATWTYLTTDLPFGNLSDRIARGWARKFRRWAT
ncbi:MAG: accessory Sec system translocase SecA2 [Acidobacteriota bacterium]|nr:accessory Sec system translocase SecA2 [Acidobacteriota bacterium]